MTTSGDSARRDLGRPGLSWRGDGALGGPRHAPAFDVESPLHGPPEAAREQPIEGMQIATFSRRVGGFAIDLGVLFAATFVMGMFLYAPEPAAGAAQDEALTSLYVAHFILRFGYFWLFNSLGWSPGKRAVGLRIVTADGEVPGVGKGFARAVGAVISDLVFLLGYIWAAWDPKRQTWHDKIAGTYVVHAEEEPAPARR